MEILSIKELSFTYPEEQQPALESISLSVSEGEFVILCGLSGSGKSTLLRLLKPAVSPAGKREGTILFSGKEPEQWEPSVIAGQIGFVMQSPEHQTVTENVRSEISFGLENAGAAPEEMHRRIAELSVYFGLEDILDRKTDELSGGQKQILNLAAVMLLQPSLLLLDEPFSQLDPVAASQLAELLGKLNRELGMTIILAEQNPEPVYALSSRVMLLSEGRLVFDGQPQAAPAYFFQSEEPLFDALPIAARAYTAAGAADNGTVPLTIAEGRRWLREYMREKPLCQTVPPDCRELSQEMPLAELRHIWYRYQKDSPFVVKNASLQVFRGEIVAVLGGNGAGKTTLLQLIAGIMKPQEGSIRRERSIRTAYLPQSVTALFVCDTIYEHLCESMRIAGLTVSDSQIQSIAELCDIRHLLKRHPYDLSGGEQQRAALAGLLLLQPQLLLLDEPVKNLDVTSRQKTGRILRALAERGACVVIVSHDTEFCAEYADRCAVFFSGKLSAPETPENFFTRNMFFTTPARRMTRSAAENIITGNQLLAALGKPPDEKAPVIFPDSSPPPDKPPARKKKPMGKILSGILKAVLVVLFLFGAAGSAGIIGGISFPASAAVTLFSGVLLIVWERFAGEKTAGICITPMNSSVTGMIAAVITMTVAVPLTIFVGIYYLNDAKYLFISLLILLECMVPFFIMFEKRKIRTRELVLISVMCALCVFARAAFYMLPEFKPMTAMVIITGACLGAESGFLTGAVTMLVSNILFSQGPWTPWQMAAMGLVGLLSGLIFGRGRHTGQLSCAVFGFFAAVVIYGGIMDPAAMIMSHVPVTSENLAAYYTAGLPLDIVHGISTAVFLYIGAEPLIRKLERVKKKYGLLSRMKAA